MGVIRGFPLTMKFRRSRNRGNSYHATDTSALIARRQAKMFQHPGIELPDKTRGKYAPRLLEKNTREKISFHRGGRREKNADSSLSFSLSLSSSKRILLY